MKTPSPSTPASAPVLDRFEPRLQHTMTAPASTNTLHFAIQPLEPRLHFAASIFDDIVTTPTVESPMLVKAGRFGYFDAAPGISLQLTRTDGTPGGTTVIKGIPAGEHSGEMAVIGDDLFLLTRASESDTTTSTIWRIGPSTDAATLVHRFAPGVQVHDIIAAGDALYFSHCGPSDSDDCRLWTSDGTATGTRLYTDRFVDPQSLTSFNGRLYFFATMNPPLTYRLYRTAPDAPRGFKIITLPRQPLNVSASIIVAQDKLFVRMGGITSGSHIYTLRGDTSTARVIKTTRPIERIAAAGRHLVFTHRGDDGSIQLWHTNGSGKATRRLKTFRLGPEGGVADLSVEAGSNVFFTLSGDRANDLWVTDGTAKGTRRLLQDGVEWQPIWRGWVAAGDTIYFSRAATAGGVDLWKSDGTPNGTRRVAASDDDGYGFAGPIGTLDGRDLISWFHDDDGRQIRRIDGATHAARRLLALPKLNFGSDPQSIIAHGSKLYYTAHGTWKGKATWGLWERDESAGSTRLIVDQPPYASDIRIVNGRPVLSISFAPTAHPRRPIRTLVWTPDGRGGWHMLLDQTARRAVSVVNTAGRLYFIRDEQLWTSDATPQGTKPLDLKLPKGTRLTGSLAATGSRVYFSTANHEDDTQDLWVAEDDATTPRRIRAFAEAEGLGSIHNLTAVGDRLFFSVADAGGGSLWVTDGDEQTTRRLKPVVPRGPVAIDAPNGLLYFVAAEPLDESQLWVSNGTPDGTRLVKDINPSDDASINHMTIVGQRLFFVADDGVHGWRLWTSDGTPDGTRLVNDSASGNPQFPSNFTAAGDKLVFSAHDDLHGRELWITDGTEAGTRVLDLYPGSVWSSPANFTIFGDRLIFSANDGVHGNELWQMPLIDLG